VNWRRPILKALLHAKAWGSDGAADVSAIYQRLLALEFADRGRLTDAVNEGLRRLLAHAAEHTAYYREVLHDCGVIQGQPTKVDLSRLPEVPMLTKDVLRDRYADLLSEERHERRAYVNTSGGSTGEPVEFVQDNVYQAWNWATALFYNHMVGKALGEREVKLWGSQRDVLEGSVGVAAKLQNLLYNRVLMNTFLMTPDALRRYVGVINRFRPKSLWAYVDSAYELARYVEAHNIEVAPIPVTIVTAGVLTGTVRETIERALHTRVYNQYGSREVGPLACECPEQSGLHVFDWATYVEVVDAQGRPVAAGEEGEVCVTLLANFSMPFIRFRIGDTAVLTDAACPCGRPMRLLREVSGRVTDHFVRRDGAIVHGQFFAFNYYHRPWVVRFQVVQEDYDLVVNRLAVRERPAASEEKDITRNIRTVMGESCRVTFEYVDAIPPTPSGKYLYTLSKVAR